MEGPFRRSVTETGELKAENAVTVTVPNIDYKFGSRLKIIDLEEHGKVVQKGDPVIRLDPASVHKFIIERRESLENEIAALNKLEAQLKNNLQDLKAQLRNEQSAFDIKKLQTEGSAFESEGIRKVRELEFRQAEIRLNRLKRQLEIRPGLDSLDYRIQRIKIIQKEDELEAAEATLGKMIVISPLNGVFVLAPSRMTGQIIKVGDEVYLGDPVAKIPDLTKMMVDGIIPENDISRIKAGQDVIVRLDALPSVPFHGKISNVGRVCIELDERKGFLTEVVISETDLRLKPGMTVSCEYITYESEKELYVPNNFILEEDGHFYVFLRKRAKTRKTEVTPGPSNNMFTVVSGDLKPGQAIELPARITTE
jgi:multidrug efflux pump subunit AcrA (membrane-fusion protein)